MLQVEVMAFDHGGTVAHFQTELLHVLDDGEPVAGVRVSQGNFQITEWLAHTNSDDADPIWDESDGTKLRDSLTPVLE